MKNNFTVSLHQEILRCRRASSSTQAFPPSWPKNKVARCSSWPVQEWQEHRTWTLRWTYRGGEWSMRRDGLWHTGSPAGQLASLSGRLSEDHTEQKEKKWEMWRERGGEGESRRLIYKTSFIHATENVPAILWNTMSRSQNRRKGWVFVVVCFCTIPSNVPLEFIVNNQNNFLSRSDVEVCVTKCSSFYLLGLFCFCVVYHAELFESHWHIFASRLSN